MSTVQILVAFAWTYAGLVALSVGFDRHYRQLRQGRMKLSLSRYLAVRASGWLLLGVSLWTSLQASNGGIGWVIWFGVLSVATALLVLQLAYAPRPVLALAGVAGSAAVLLMAISF